MSLESLVALASAIVSVIVFVVGMRFSIKSLEEHRTESRVANTQINEKLDDIQSRVVRLETLDEAGEREESRKRAR